MATETTELVNFLNNPEIPISKERANTLFSKFNESGVSNSEIQDLLLNMSQNSSERNTHLLKTVFDWFLEYSQEEDNENITTKKEKLLNTVGTISIMIFFAGLYLEPIAGINRNLRVEYPILNNVGNIDNMVSASVYLYGIFAASVGLSQSALIKKDALKYKKIIDLASDFMYSIAPIIAITFAFLLGLDVETFQLTPLPQNVLGTPDLLDIPAGLIGVIAGAKIIESFRSRYATTIDALKKKVTGNSETSIAKNIS